MDETAIVALLTQMVRNGVIDEATVLGAAAECEAEGARDAAHQIRCLLVEAGATPATERVRADRLSRLTSIDGGNRG